MLTISQLATHAGVTVRAIRHYHAKGLLPEPERDRSGYRSYDAAAVVQLIKIRTLAEAGVPLARVRELLTCDETEFAAAVREVDLRLREEIRERQEHRRRIAQLAAGDNLALPGCVVAYLDLLRREGVTDEAVALERDAWILVAARWPDRIEAMMADKVAQLADPRVAGLYRLLSQVAQDWDEHGGPTARADQLLEEAADLLDELYREAEAAGRMGPRAGEDAGFVRLVDAYAVDAHPAVGRLQEKVAARGWSGWSQVTKQ